MLQSSEDTRLERVLDIIKSLGIRFPVAELSKKLKFSKGQVSGILNNKIPMSDTFYKGFIEKYDNSSNKVQGKNVLQEPEGSFKTSFESKKVHNSDRALNTIYSLAESNKVLADNNTIIAQAQLKLVETNSELAVMLKDIFNKTTVNAAAKSHPVVTAIDPVVLELLLDFLQGKYNSKREALSVYNRMTHVEKKKGGVKDIRLD